MLRRAASGAARRFGSGPPPPAAASFADLPPGSVRTPLLTLVLGGGASLVAAAAAEQDADARAAREAVPRLLRAAGAAILGLEPPAASPPAWAKSLPPAARRLAADAAERWRAAEPGDRAILALAGANAAVWLAFKPALVRPAAEKIFAHALPPARARAGTLLLSNVAHRGGLHLAANLIALWQLGRPVASDLGPCQFLGFAAAAGLAASAAAHVGRVASPAARFAGGTSLGLSGIVYGVVVLAAAARPDQSVQFIFLDKPLRLADAVGALVAVDVLGAAAGWRVLDHWGHLGGAAAGWAYARWGGSAWAWAHSAAATARAARDRGEAWLEERARRRRKE